VTPAREDLGALFGRMTRRLFALEKPLLAAQGLKMWDYIVLQQLNRGPVARQLELADAIGHDKTRLITVLDRLERGGLIARTPHPHDRRAHSVSLTPHGRAKLQAARRSIAAMEEQVLAPLSSSERQSLLRALERLTRKEDR
jgi:DNA-binding MarR family transcriptional regulator